MELLNFTNYVNVISWQLLTWQTLVKIYRNVGNAAEQITQIMMISHTFLKITAGIDVDTFEQKTRLPRLLLIDFPKIYIFMNHEKIVSSQMSQDSIFSPIFNPSCPLCLFTLATRYLQQYRNWYRAESYLESLERFRMECIGHRQLFSFSKLK